MAQYQPMAGEGIREAVVSVVGMATRAKERVECSFNDIRFWAEPSEDFAQVLARYETLREVAEATYACSPEGLAAAADAKARAIKAQSDYDAAMERLSGLDFGSDSQVLGWITEIQGPADNVNVVGSANEIVSLFGSHGFRSNVNTGDDFNENDRDNVYRYLVGQAMDGFATVGAPHPIIHKFVAEWRERFGIPAEGE